MTFIVSPSPGDAFAVPGRRDALTVAQLIASFVDEAKGEGHYLVQSPAGARWILVESNQADGPQWIGRPVPAEARQL